MPATTPSPEPTPVRRVASWALLYVFGLAVTTLLVGVWGRAVTGDATTLATGVRAAVESQLIADRMEGWLADTAAEGSAPVGSVEATLHRVVTSAEVQRALDVMVRAVIEGAVADPATATTVDAGAILAPVGRVMVDELARTGLDVSPDRVATALSELEPIVLAVADGGISGAMTTANGALTVAAVLATLAALVTGGVAVLLADDRIGMARTLVFRVAIGAATFVLVTRIGAWALDPSAGRSPLAAGGSVLLGSHTGVLVSFMVAGAFAGTGLGAYAVRRRAAAQTAGQSGDRSMQESVDDDPTVERVLVDV